MGQALQAALVFLLLGDVGKDADEVADAPAIVMHGADRHQHRRHRPGLGAIPHLALPEAPLGDHLEQLAEIGTVVVAGIEHAGRLADGLLPGVAGEFAEGPVHLDDQALRVGDEDAVVAVLEHAQSQPVLLLPFLAVGDVPPLGQQLQGLARLVLHRLEDEIHVAQAAVPAHVGDLETLGLAARRHPLDGLAQALLHQGLMHPPGRFPEQLAQHLGGLAADQVQGRLVGLQQAPLEVQDADELAGLVEDGAQAQAAFPELGADRLAFLQHVVQVFAFQLADDVVLRHHAHHLPGRPHHHQMAHVLGLHAVHRLAEGIAFRNAGHRGAHHRGQGLLQAVGTAAEEAQGVPLGEDAQGPAGLGDDDAAQAAGGHQGQGPGAPYRLAAAAGRCSASPH